MKKILVVDNHPIILKFMSNLLEKKGHKVLTAEDGLSALKILKNYIPDVIFIDLVMPNIDGRKLCQIIRRMTELKDAFLVILSAIAAEVDLDCAELGADVCIAKGPLDKMEKNIFAALDQCDKGDSEDVAKEVIGLENVTPRALTEELLSDRKHFEVILKSMSEGILEITHEARVVFANPSALSLIGVPEETLLASNFTDVFSEKDRHRVKTIWNDMGGAVKIITRDSPVAINGKEVELKIMPLEEEGHKAVVILNDVSEQRHREDRLRQAQRMEAVGTLAAGIAHDFNNLLTGIQGYASLMLFNMDSDHPHYKMLEGIEKQVKSGSKLTSQLLGYARKGKYEIKPIDLNQLVIETSDAFGRTKKETSIHRELAPDLFTIKADQNQMDQVLLNMYINAADAMPGGGDLFLQTMNTTHKDMTGKPYNPKPGDYVLLTVTDTGAGMDKKTMEHIFEPFFTTKEMGRGIGLGMASVYGIVKGHGGYIDVDSEKGRGTTFRIYLPAIEADGEMPGREGGKQGGIARSYKTILLVDDENMIREVGREMLEVKGYRVLTAADGNETITVYEENRDRIDLILLDMVMPNMGGGKAYDRLKEINPDVKVLLSSGYSIDGEATEILERGCNGFIQKPFKIEDLSQKIREILDSSE